MGIDDITLLCISAPFRFFKITCTTSIDGCTVIFHPLSDFLKNLYRLFRESSSCIRSNIENHISVFADTFHKRADQKCSRFVVCILGTITPVFIHGYTCFPWHRLSDFVDNSIWWNHLFRGSKVSGCTGWMFFHDGTWINPISFHTVVGYHVRLVCINHIADCFCTPFILFHFIIGKIKPHDIQFSIPCQQFSDLSMHVIQISVPVPVFIGTFRMIAHRMMSVTIVWEIRMMPVNQRIIKTYL